MYNTYLSIGTVLMLKGEGKKVMVIGYLGYDKTGKAADYMGVTYPEGYMSSDSIIGFNETEILERFFHLFNFMSVGTLCKLK